MKWLVALTPGPREFIAKVVKLLTPALYNKNIIHVPPPHREHKAISQGIEPP